MVKRLSVFLALALCLTMLTPFASFATGAMTDVGTPRAETLIMEPDGGATATPGQFNPFMTGTSHSFGMHQIMYNEGLWDVNTMTGERIPTVAADLATHNDDYTEWTIPIRQGLKWSDGETLDANDVVFTLNLILSTPEITFSPYYNSIFEKVELVDDYTLKVYCKSPFTRIMTTLGVNSWGCDFRIVPEHIYKDVDVMSFTNSEPVFGGPYKLHSYDELGTWILYEKREDWDCTPTGILYGEPGPKYVLYRVFGNQESRVMAMINNEVDGMNEVALEDLKLMMESNPNVRAWYKDFPLANTDDACAKGLFFNTAIEPFNNPDVRWALTLCCDFIEVSENIFEGIGRMSALSIPAVSAMENLYYKPMGDWLTNEFALDDGYKPWDPDFALTLAKRLEEDFDYDLSAYSDEQIKDIFGSGYWKTDKEKATELMEKSGFELKDGKWYKDGEQFKISVLVHPEEDSTQASRSGKAIADQWQKFGIEVEVTTVSAADIGNRINLGDFEAVDSWDACSAYTQDFYNNIQGWNAEVYSYELGEKATGISSYRLPQSDPELAAEISALVKQIQGNDPDSAENKEMLTEFLKLTTKAHLSITVHAGTKIVPINTTYWSGFPTAEDPYEGPWWWWSLFRFMLPKLAPAS